jgi:putative hemolysin
VHVAGSVARRVFRLLEERRNGMLTETNRMNPALTLMLFVILLALTAFFNLAEMGLIAARTAVLENSSDSTAARTALALKKRPGLFLAAIRAGDFITDLLIGAFVVTWLTDFADGALRRVPFIGRYAPAIAGTAAFIVVPSVTLIFVDLAPKSIALGAPERIATLIARPLNLLIFAARPFLVILEGSNSLILRLLHVRHAGENKITQQEIRRVLSEGLTAGALLSFERSMMERILNLQCRSVRTVMTGRRYIQFLRANMDAKQLSKAALDATASRLLVTRDGDLDKLVGVVSRADVLAALARDAPLDLAALAIPPSYVSENTSVLSVLETLKSMPVHMAMVVDEFGSLVGLVTLADVLEAVAGDLAGDAPTPHASVSNDLEPQSDGSYLVSAQKPLDDIAEVFAFDEPATRTYKTLGGLVIDRLRRIPREGETINLPALRIEVVQVEQGAIKTLRLVPK